MLVENRFPPFQNIGKILVIQLGDIGDVVWTLPTLLAIREAYPLAEISLLAREGRSGFLAGDPLVHRTYETGGETGGFWRRTWISLRCLIELRRAGFDLVFDLRADERGAFAALFSGARRRASLFYRNVPAWRNRAFTHLVNEPPPPAERILGAAEQSLRIVRSFGIPTKTQIPRLRLSPETDRAAGNLLSREGIEGPWVSINPFSRWAYKEWKDPGWHSIMQGLWEEWRMPTVLVGSGAERERADGLAAGSPAKVWNLAGRTTIAELAALLRRSRLHIGVDSAAPHIAAAIGTPTVTLYGPTDWRDWAPIGDGHRVVVSSLDCVPCFRKGCDGRGTSRCMDELTVDEVMEAVRAALTEAVSPPRSA